MEGIICPLVEISLAEQVKPSSSTAFLRLSYGQETAASSFTLVLYALSLKKKAASQYHSSVEVNPVLSDLNTPGTSKLDWRYFERNKVDRNELQVRKSLHKGTGTKMAEKLNNLTEKNRSFLFLCLYANF